jgi:hypothetical protein
MRKNTTLAHTLHVQLVLVKSPVLKSRHLPLQIAGRNPGDKGYAQECNCIITTYTTILEFGNCSLSKIVLLLLNYENTD